MAKTIEQLQAALEKAQETQALATEGLSVAVAAHGEAMAPFGVDEDGNVGGTPEELELVLSATRDLVTAIRANWKFRGLPTQTEERRAKAIEATKKSQAKRKEREAAGAKG